MMSTMKLTRDAMAHFDAAARHEWLVTNGLGGFACGTVSGARTRRYHGLLVAALRPPVGRCVLLAKLDAVAHYGGSRFDLGCNEYADGAIDGRGFSHLESFAVEGLVPTFAWAIADARLVQRVWMAQGENTTCVSFALERATQPIELEVVPLCTGRDYHAELRGPVPAELRPVAGGVEIAGFPGMPAWRLVCDRGRFDAMPDWYWNFRHRVEAERGLDATEDLLRPGVFRLTLAPGESATFVCSTREVVPHAGDSLLARERRRAEELLRAAPPGAPDWVQRLVLAADQYLVRRGPDGTGASVIAGYPWFADWGRDTMIALPGLTLAIGRRDVAARILRTFAGHVSEGMLPNRFPDAGETPEYNTVDATLWYFHALDRYLAQADDEPLARELYPVLCDIIDAHRRGTRYGIRVDPDDGLLASGEPGVQLTWMDARVGDRVVTPRTGKAVEINALWHNALAVTAALAAKLRDDARANELATAAARVRASFEKRFWHGAGGHLYDVIDTPSGEPDASLRPNQLFALSLPHRLLEGARARAVVDACARTLWTPVGLRSLAPGEAGYTARYAGGPEARDGAYHQGTVWSWLLGPFALAHYAAYGDAPRALAWLEPVAAHLADACVGQVSEVFDGDAPHAPGGCFAQAWSVAELLRAWLELAETTRTRTTGSRTAARTTRMERA
jgi:predicted glycogen debranching enzyme